MTKPGLKILILITLLISTGCNKNKSGSDQNSNPPSSSPLILNELIIAPLVKNYSTMLQNKLDASTQSTLLLKESIDNFLAKPDTINLEKAKQKWHDSYLSFNQTAPFRILQSQKYNGVSKASVIDSSIGNPIDSWPIMPGYIDAISGFPNSGIVNDITLTLNKKNLRAQHRLTSPDEVSIGFHAIEFMLWGDSTTQNNNSNALKNINTKKPAPEKIKSKPVSRFLPVTHWEQTELNINQHSNNRRRKYLSLSSSMLLYDIEKTNNKVKSIWQLNPDARQVFIALYMQLGEIRKQLSNFNGNPYTSGSLSGDIHNDLILYTHSINDLIKPLAFNKQANSEKAIQIFSLTVFEIEKTLEELEKTPEESGLWDRLDFNLSQLESFLFTASNGSD